MKTDLEALKNHIYYQHNINRNILRNGLCDLEVYGIM